MALLTDSDESMPTSTSVKQSQDQAGELPGSKVHLIISTEPWDTAWTQTEGWVYLRFGQ